MTSDARQQGRPVHDGPDHDDQVSRSPDLHAELTEREQTVLSGIARGLSNREIAAELYLSVETVKTHARRIYDKLGVRNRTEATIRSLHASAGPIDQPRSKSA